MSRSHQIAINAISQWGVTILGSALGLMLVPFLIAKLGKDGYGLIAVTMAIAGVCALADLGISGALGRQLSEALATGKESQYGHLLSTAFALNLLMGLASALAVFFAAGRLASFFALPASLAGTGIFLIRTYGAAHVLFTFLTPAAKAVLASHNRFDISSQVDAVRRLVETTGLFVVLASTAAGIAGWAMICIAADAVSMALLWRAAAKMHAGLRVAASSIRISSARELFCLGSQFTLLQLGGQLSVNADPFILTSCLGPASLSLYRPPAQVFSAMTPLVSTLANQLHPLATKAHVAGDKKDLTAILLRGTKYTMLMGAVFCALVISLADPLCEVWLGRALGGQHAICATLLKIQALTNLGAFAAGTQWPVLLGMKRTAFASYGRLALAVLNIASSWVLVRYTELGVVGVIIPTMVIELAWRPLLAHHVCRVLGIRVADYFRASYWRPLLSGSLVALAGFSLTLAVRLNTIERLAIAAFFLTVVGAVSAWSIGLSQPERRSSISSLRPLAGALR
jgi:membrane protein EpsK